MCRQTDEASLTKPQVPISQGGSNISWSSPSIATMLSIGAALCCAFLFWEGRFAKVPIMPSESHEQRTKRQK